MSLSDADRLAILEVVTRADNAASRRDADAYVALFTPRGRRPCTSRSTRSSSRAGKMIRRSSGPY
jgi:hypothetical protein